MEKVILMTQKMQNSSKFNIFWSGLSAVLIIAGIWANYHYAAQPIAIRLIGWIVLAAIVIAITLQTSYGQRFWKFLQECRLELRKVTWPTRQETVQTTTIVVIAVVALSLVLWALDSILLWIVAFLTGQRG
ncbi:MAG: preprotein translocase subunit SecE [Gammaproteobacteria bacterium]